MKANETKCLHFLKQPKQFQIPIYQRPYSWTRRQCEQLWKDVARAGDDADTDSHFVGSIVYIHDGLFAASDLPRLLVIDGQQRLTTLSLLILALADEAERRIEAGEGDDLDAEPRKLRNYHLVNPEEEGELRYKLLLTYGDRETLCRLIDVKPVDAPGMTPSPRVVQNLEHFRGKLADATAEQINAVWAGMNKLMMIDVSLDRQHDDPQLIFESLNSTGLELSQADLIRNYVLMGLASKAQRDLFEGHWQPMERAFGQDNYAKSFDGFVRHYLTLRTRQIPNIRQVYREFKRYCQERDAAVVVADLHRFAGHFVRISLGAEPDKVLRRRFAHLARLEVKTAMPFLLEVYDDFSQGVICLAELREVVGLVESYVFRRVLCDIPTNTLNKTFAALATRIDKSSASAYVESLRAAFLLMRGSTRFPADAELVEKLEVKDVYNLRTRDYCLAKLENHGRKEQATVSHYTIEHVLPQNRNLSSEWTDMLGPDWKHVQERRLHTLGNLTLTGYNSELSDRPFADKRDHEGGFANSPLWLNKSLAKLDHWDEAAIESRGNMLAKRAVNVWPAPHLDDDVLQTYRKTEEAEYDLAHHGVEVGPAAELYEKLHHRIMALDDKITRQVRKFHIAYKLDRNFADVAPLRSALDIFLNVKAGQIDDPDKIAKNMTGIGHQGNGDLRLRLRSVSQLDDFMPLIRQSYLLHGGSEEGL